MRLLEIIWRALNRGHKHYWGVPYTTAVDDNIRQCCYECGALRRSSIVEGKPT